MWEGSDVSTFSPVLAIFCVSSAILVDPKLYPIVGVICTFPMTKDTEHVLVGHLYSFLREITIEVLRLFLNWVAFSHLVSCLFTLLMVLFLKSSPQTKHSDAFGNGVPKRTETAITVLS